QSVQRQGPRRLPVGVAALDGESPAAAEFEPIFPVQPRLPLLGMTPLGPPHQPPVNQLVEARPSGLAAHTLVVRSPAPKDWVELPYETLCRKRQRTFDDVTHLPIERFHV